MTQGGVGDAAEVCDLQPLQMAEAVGDAPIFVVGYSNGGALAVEYLLSTVGDTEAVRPAGVLLLSPAIGVSPIAAFAVWQARLGWLLGIERLEISWPPEDGPWRRTSLWSQKCRVILISATDEECWRVAERLSDWHTDPANPWRDVLSLWFEPDGLSDETLLRHGFHPSDNPELAEQGYWLNPNTGGSLRMREEAEYVVAQWLKLEAWGKKVASWMTKKEKVG